MAVTGESAARNPVTLADRPTLKRPRRGSSSWIRPSSSSCFATAYPDDAFGRIEPTLYLTAAMTGLRQGELLGLRWRDVDFDAREVRVVSPFVRGEFGDPKSAGSGRSVPMAERVALALGELRERSYYAHDRDLVFCHPETGKPLDRSKLVRRFKQAINRAGVHRITFASSATPSGRGWRPPARRCGRSSTGWATSTRRPRRSTRTTSRATRRPTPSIGRLRDRAADPRRAGAGRQSTAARQGRVKRAAKRRL
jgi:Phage integrase family